MCYVDIILSYYAGDYIYRNGFLRNNRRSDMFLEYTRLFVLSGFIFNTVAGNLMLN